MTTTYTSALAASGVPATMRALMLASLQPALDAYSAELARHGAHPLAGRHACTCGWVSDRPTSRGGAVSLGRHIAAADAAAEDTYNLAVRTLAATLPPPPIRNHYTPPSS